METGGNGPIKVLLARDVKLVDEIQSQEQRQLQRDIDRLIVDEERWCVIKFVGADGRLVEPVCDVLPGLLFHQRRAVILTHLREGGPHVAEHLSVVGHAVAARGAAAEELRPCQELLVDLQAAGEADCGVVGGGHFFERLERQVFHARVNNTGEVAGVTSCQLSALGLRGASARAWEHRGWSPAAGKRTR